VQPYGQSALTHRNPGGSAIATPACPVCGRTAGPDDRFCGRCGNALALICPQCGRAHLPSSDLLYCTGCGQPLRSDGSAGYSGGVEQSGRAERRRVCVLFIDAVGSTPFAERADPETVRAMQTEFFATVRQVVRQYGGVVEKYIGDAAMALFGAPVATETDAVRCVRAGLDLQRALARMGRPAGSTALAGSTAPAESSTQAESSAQAEADGWSYRVGVATGEALVDVTAAHDGGQAIVAGDVVNTAARLQAEAPAGGVLVCGATQAATRSEIRYAAQPALTLRGRTTPTEVWLAVAAVPQQIDDDADAIAMVGRDHELSLVTSALQHVIRERRPQVVTVLGPAGIGKSRLVRELYQHASQMVDVGVCWRSGRCPPFGENVAYAALADIVKAHAGVLATDTPEAARDRLDAALRDLVPPSESARLSDALRPLVGLAGSPLSTEDAESAWRRFLLALAGRGPTVLVVEDVHWADEKMIRFIQLIGGTVRDVPLLVVCTARPELIDREPAWASAVPGMLLISLTPLRDDSIANLYAQMFGAAVLPPDLLRPLVELADGMPLYAHEYGRMLVDRGTLRRSDRHWVVEPSDDLPMPENVHAVIANRIDLLEPGERAVLQAAAVVGQRFWPGAVAAALGAGIEQVEGALRTLTRRDLVRELPDSSMADEPELRFRHVLVSDVCYERLPLSDRITRHVRAADWLDARTDRRGTDLVEVVAHHRFTAYESALALGLDPRPYAGAALAALRDAARRAAMLNAFDAMAAHLDRAERLLESVHAPAGEADRLGVELLGIELAINRDSTSFRLGAGPDRLTELANLLYRAGDLGGAARAWTLLGQIAWLRADRTDALRCLDRAIELFDNWPDTPEKAHAYAELGRLHMLNYEHTPALGATQIAAEIAERLGLVELRANALITLGMCRYQAGERDGLDDLQAALEFCRVHQVPSLRRASQNVAYALHEEGSAGDGLALSVDAPDALGERASLDAMQALFAGDWDRFFAVADSVLDTPGEWDLQLRGVRAWMRALRGDLVGASVDTSQALAAARSSGFWRLRWTALAHGALCEAVLDHGPDAAVLLEELSEGWRRMRTIASGEWVPAAGHAASRLGPDVALLLRDALGDAPHQTAWSRAALSSLTGTVAAGRGDYTAAAMSYLDAASRYAAVGSETDRFLALSAAVRVLSAAADVRAAAPQRELAEFVRRNGIVSPL
jgi:predicted ATPase/class 3 adenylate cyclase